MARAPGFSLVELLIVVALLGVFALVAIPAAEPGGDKKLEAATQIVVDAIRFSQIEAQRTSGFHGVDFGIDPATGMRRVRVFRTDTSSPPTPVYDVRHPLEKTLFDQQFASMSATAGVTIASAKLYYINGSTVLQREWIAFDAAGMPEYYPDSSNVAAHSNSPNISKITLDFQGRSKHVLIDPVNGRVHAVDVIEE